MRQLQQHPQPPAPADWYAWLRRAGLDPPSARDCAALLCRQQLEPADAPEFDHDLLRTAGVTIAKHRLQILRLARDEARAPTPLAMLRGLVSAAAGRLASLCRRRSGNGPQTAPVIVSPNPAMLRRSSWGGGRGTERNGIGGAGVVAGLLTPTSRKMLKRAGGRAKVAAFGPAPPSPLPLLPFPCAPVPLLKGRNPKMHGGKNSSDSTAEEQDMRWDAMFQDLKPT